MCAAVNIHPIDPLRGPIVETIVNGNTWTSQPWNTLTHRSCTVYVSSDKNVTLFIDHASGGTALVGSPISSTHAVAAGVPAAFHEKLDGRVSQVRISNASGLDATVTVDVILRPTGLAEDNASTRLTLAGVDVSAGNPLPTAGAVVGDVDVVQAVAADLNAVVHGWDGSATQRVLVAANGRLQVDTPALSSTSSSITAEPGAGSFSVAQSTASNLNATVTQAGTVTVTGTVSQADPSALHATVTQAGTVSTEGLEMQVATILSPNNTASYPVVGACRVYGVFFAHGSTNEQNLALYDATSGVVPATARKMSLMLGAGDVTMVVPGGGYVVFADGIGLRSTTTQDPTSTVGSSSDTVALLFYRLVV
jgi:hypothetical protein